MSRNKKRSSQIIDNSGFSLYQLANFNQNLKNSCEQTHRLRQQIKLQKSTQGKVNKDISESINKIQNEGAYFASRLEEERQKYETLSSLVTHYQKSNYQEKVNKYEDSKNKKEADENELNVQKLKQIEKQYDHIVLKANSSLYEVSKKTDQVRMLRSERAIFNGLFDQIERQLFQVQLNYKQMVIQRSFLQSQYKEKTQQFEYIQQQTQEEEERLMKKLIKNRNNTENQHNQGCEQGSENRKLNININSLKDNESTNFNSLRLNGNKVNKKTQRKYENQGSQKGKTVIELQKIEYERKVKEMMYNLQVKKISEIPISREVIETKITELFGKANFLYERIYEKKEKLNTIQEGKPKIQKSKQTKRVQKLHQLVQNLDNNKNQIENEINKFQQTIGLLKKQLKIQKEADDIQDNVGLIDEQMVQMFPKINSCEYSQVRQGQQKLNIILNKNKTTKTTGRIYTEEDLIAISKFNLRQDVLEPQIYE